MASLKTHPIGFCLGAMLAVLVALHFFALPKLAATQMIGGGIETSIILPEMFPEGAVLTHMYIDWQPGQQNRLEIFVEGCLRRLVLNNINVGFDQSGRCNYRTPLSVTLPFKPGKNVLSLETDRIGDLHVSAPLFDSNPWRLANWLGLVLIGLAALVVLLIMRRISREWGSGIIMAAGFLLFCNQFVHTYYMDLAYDMPGHLEYIAYIAENWRWPKPQVGLMYYHAPLYYSVGAVIIWLANQLGSFDPMSVLRSFSLACYMVFLGISALMLKRIISNTLVYYVVLVLFVFYPSGILTSSRIDSHLLLYVFYSACIYFLWRWLEDSEDKHLGWALIMIGLGLATRSNSYLLLPLLILAFCYRWWRKKSLLPPLNLRAMIIIVGLIVLYYGAVINVGRHYVEGNHIIDNTRVLPRGLRVQNSIDKFILFDWDTYVRYPFWDPWHDTNGRQYFWNSLLKTSLFGEFHLGQPVLAQSLSLLLLCLILYGTVSISFNWDDMKKRRELWCLLILLGAPVAALIRSRLYYPFSCVQDFRYIYPALMAFCGLLALSIEHYRNQQKNLRASIGIGICSMFTLNTVVFFLTQ